MATGLDRLRDVKKKLAVQSENAPESRGATARARSTHANPFEQMRQVSRELGSSIEIMKKILGKDWAGGKPSPMPSRDKMADRVIVTNPDHKKFAAGISPKNVDSPRAGLAAGRQGHQNARILDRPTKEAMATLAAPEASESRQDVERLVTVKGMAPHTELRKEPSNAQRAELPTAARVQQAVNAHTVSGGTSPTAARLVEMMRQGKRESVAAIPPGQLVAKIRAELGSNADKALEAPNVKRLTEARDSRRDVIRGVLTSMNPRERARLNEVFSARQGRMGPQVGQAPAGRPGVQNGPISTQRPGQVGPGLAQGPSRQPGPGVAAALEQPGAEATEALAGNDITHLETAKADMAAGNSSEDRASIRESAVATARARPRATQAESPETALAQGRVTASAASLSKDEPRARESKPGKMTFTFRDKGGHQLGSGDVEMT